MDVRAWTTGDGPKAIFNDAVVWLLERGVLLPGVTTLARLVAQVRDEATQLVGAESRHFDDREEARRALGLA